MFPILISALLGGAFILVATRHQSPLNVEWLPAPLAGPVLPRILPGGFNLVSEGMEGGRFDGSVKHNPFTIVCGDTGSRHER